MYKEFEKLALNRQSCREFSDKPIEKETLDKIMQLAMLAPSACNSQPWKMICAFNEESVKSVRENLQIAGRNTFLNGAKAFIAIAEKVATLKPDTMKRFDRNRFVKYDVGELIAYLTLGAESLGVSTCIIGWMNEEKLATTLNLDQDEICRVVVALGYSDIETRDKVRKEKEEVISYL